jgi:hypothetical protein
MTNGVRKVQGIGIQIEGGSAVGHTTVLLQTPYAGGGIVITLLIAVLFILFPAVISSSRAKKTGIGLSG